MQGRLKVSSVANVLEEGDLTEAYNRLKKEAELLVANINARTRLASELGEIEDDIRWKSEKLKDIIKDIERATEHYNALKILLEKLGVLNPKAYTLNFDTQLLLSEAGSNVVMTPTEIYPGSDF
jgi:hypothetical protein